MTLGSHFLSPILNLLGRWRRRDVALWLVSKYSRLRPGDPFGWGIQGHILRQLGRPNEAEGVLKKGREIHANDPQIAWLLSSVLMQNSCENEAEVLLRDLLQSHPGSELGSLGLVELYVRRGLPEDALKTSFVAERQIASNDYAKLFELALLLGYLPETQERAISLLKVCVKAWPDFAPAQALLGILLENREDPEANKHLNAARRHYRESDDFDEFVQDIRYGLSC